MRFIVIGVTDNPRPWFPPEVMEIIRSARVFSGGRRHHEIVAPLLPADAQWIDITVPLDTVFEAYKSVNRKSVNGKSVNGKSVNGKSVNGKSLVVFASGDPLFFGFANTIRRRMPDAEVVVYPSFNSLQLLAHRLLMPYHDMCIVSLTGRPWPALDRALIGRAAKIGVLTDREHTPAAIARRMLDYGYACYTMHVGEHLGNPEKERVSTLTLSAAAQTTFDTPNCILLEATDNVQSSMFNVQSSFGIPDSEFALLDGREKMITKMPIRLLTLQALDLPRRHVLWDIGFCTGSVSIEARLLFPHLRIEAFEVRPECEAIIHENMRRHGAPGIGVHIGDFRSVCCDSIATTGPDAARPDAVFIGGHGGHLKAILAKVLDYLTPDGCIVMNSVKAPRVALDSQALWNEACRELGLRQEPPLHIQLNEHHPITILKCKR